MQVVGGRAGGQEEGVLVSKCETVRRMQVSGGGRRAILCPSGRRMQVVGGSGGGQEESVLVSRWETDAGRRHLTLGQEGSLEEGVLVGDGRGMQVVGGRAGGEDVLDRRGRQRHAGEPAIVVCTTLAAPNHHRICSQTFTFLITKTGNREAGGSSPPGGA